MGNNQGSLTYAIPLPGTGTAETTPIMRAATHPDALVANFADKPCSNSWDIFQRGRAVGGRRPCLGWRPRAPDGTVSAEHFEWWTYNEVERNALIIGTALLDSGFLTEEYFPDEVYVPAQRMKLLGLFCRNRREWFVCEQASNAYNFALVPLYDTLGADALEYILERTRMRVVGVALDCLSSLLDGIEKTRHVKMLLMFLYPDETVPRDIMGRIEKLGLDVRYFDDWLAHPPAKMRPVCPTDLRGINTVCYTSGTTGTPKGVFLTHQNVVGCTAAIVRGPISQDFHLTKDDQVLSYLPLAHVLERLVCNVIISLGAKIGCYSGDTTQLLDDIRVYNPTVFVSVPRLFNRINDAVFRGLNDRSFVARYLFERGMSAKLDVLRNNANTNHRVWDSLVFRNTRALMGKNLRYMISGGAPLDATVQEHIKVLFCAPLMEGYGLTETFGPATMQNPMDPVAGHIGGIVPCNEYRLKSVAAMRYLVTDNPPRGELQIRGHAITPGYFRSIEDTESSLSADGWLSTGDICVILPGGALKVIDRKKNIFKLAQGEYVAPEKIEAIYTQDAFVSQIFVFGYSDQFRLVAVVVPDEEVVKSWGRRNKIAGVSSLEAYCQLPALKKAIMQSMDATAAGAGLAGFEKVKEITLESEAFSIENGLLTPTFKLRRLEAKEKYDTAINDMYAALNRP